MLNLWSSAVARRAFSAQVGIVHPRVSLRPSSCINVLPPVVSSVFRYCATSPVVPSDLGKYTRSFF